MYTSYNITIMNGRQVPATRTSDIVLKDIAISKIYIINYLYLLTIIATINNAFIKRTGHVK